MDNSGNIYFADDNGAILKYQTKELGIWFVISYVTNDSSDSLLW
jgi:hypothetical protein